MLLVKRLAAAGERSVHDVEVAGREDRGLQRCSARRPQQDGASSLHDDRPLLRRGPHVRSDIILNRHVVARRPCYRPVSSTCLS